MITIWCIAAMRPDWLNRREDILKCMDRNEKGDWLMEMRQLMWAAAMTVLLALGNASTAAAEVWSTQQAHEALQAEQIILVDIRTRGEWQETGVAAGAWPISMHEPDFERRLFALRDLAAGRPIALICASGGRSGAVMGALKRAQIDGFVDVSAGMLGSSAGTGWVKSGLPVVSLDQALDSLPDPLR